MPNKEPLFTIPSGKELQLKSTYPNLNKLDQLHQFGTEVAIEVFEMPTIPNLDTLAENAQNDLRAGFIGTVVVEDTTLEQDGIFRGDLNDRPYMFDGLLFKLGLQYAATGHQQIRFDAGLAIGFGNDSLELRAYDLNEQRFGNISCTALKKYLESSIQMGGGTGTDRVKAGALRSKTSRQQAKPR